MEGKIIAELGRRMHGIRKNLHMSQDELAERANISKQTISRIEAGKQEARATSILRLSDALGISADYLIRGEHTEIDLQYLDNRLADLTESQYLFLENIINSFISLCNNDEI